MIRIQFYRDDEALFQFQTQASFFRLGRSAECELSFQDECISRTHCLFRKKEDGWRVEDVSANGIRLEGEYLGSQFRPQENRKYYFGRNFSFELIGQDNSLKDQKTLVVSRRPTQILLADSTKDRLYLGEAKLSGKSEKGDQVVRRIGAEGLSIGRHPTNDLRIESEKVSQFHARIELRNNQYYLVDLGSTNGSSIDGKNVLRAALPLDAQLRFADENWDFHIEREELRIRDRNSDSFFGMISKSRKMKRIFSLAEAVAPTDAPVMIQGETGSGKELMAKAIHQLSLRASSPFYALNCAALPKDLLESELFGHEKGAFTGALQSRAGAFETANGGSLFLDEIAELDLSLQAKLLRVLESGETRRLGSDHSSLVSVRIISATHKDLVKLVKEGRFREDLFFRLHVVPILLPTLRERREDIPLLASKLLMDLGGEAELDQSALEFLFEQKYPGNIRQLKNILQRALIEHRMRKPLHAVNTLRRLSLEDFKFLSNAEKSREIQDLQSLKERDELIEILRQNNFNQSKTAKELNLPISTLHDRIRRLSIEIPRKRLRV